MARSPPANASRSGSRASRSSPASDASGKPGLVTARAATTARASGSRAQPLMIASTAGGSAATRAAPIRRVSSWRASSLGQQVHRERVRALGRDQAGQVVAAGDQHEAAGRAGQQRAHLVGVAGVVEHHQHPPAAAAGCGTGRSARSSPAGMRSGSAPSASRKPRIASGRGRPPRRWGRSRAG